MQFVFIPKQPVEIGKVITVKGQRMKVEAYSHTGKNVIVTSLKNAQKFKRILCIMTDKDSVII